MNEISRRKFLQIAGAAIVAAVAIPFVNGAKAKNGQGLFRVRSISSDPLRPGEIAFCGNARFVTAADAMRATASRRLTAEIYAEYD